MNPVVVGDYWRDDSGSTWYVAVIRIFSDPDKDTVDMSGPGPCRGLKTVARKDLEEGKGWTPCKKHNI